MLRVCVALLIVAAVGCERRSSAEGRIASMEANRASLRKIPGLNGENAFDAYFSRAELQMIEETPAGAGAWRNAYYFLEGKLFFYRRTVYYSRTGESGVEEQFLIDKKGAAKHTQLKAEDVERIASHASDLKRAAFERANLPIELPIMRTR